MVTRAVGRPSTAAPWATVITGWLDEGVNRIRRAAGVQSSTTAVVEAVAPATPIWGYPPLLVSYLIDSHIAQMIVVVLFGVWFLGWAGTLHANPRALTGPSGCVATPFGLTLYGN